MWYGSLNHSYVQYMENHTREKQKGYFRTISALHSSMTRLLQNVCQCVKSFVMLDDKEMLRAMLDNRFDIYLPALKNILAYQLPWDRIFICVTTTPFPLTMTLKF